MHERLPNDSSLADRSMQIFEGVEATNRLFLKGLEAQHIKKFDPTDEKFDPNLHQAMFEMPAGRPPRPRVSLSKHSEQTAP
jgi:molecular chaperone GrpE